MPAIQHLFEAAVYVQDVERARAFYADVLGLPVVAQKPGHLISFQVGEASILLAFVAEATLRDDHLPPHGAHGTSHVAFAVARAQLDEWRARLGDQGVAIEQEVDWDHGGHSLYFRDPDGNLLELATPGTWGLASGW